MRLNPYPRSTLKDACTANLRIIHITFWVIFRNISYQCKYYRKPTRCSIEIFAKMKTIDLLGLCLCISINLTNSTL